MKASKLPILVAVAVVVVAAAWMYGRSPAEVTRTGATARGTLVFPGLAPKLAAAQRIEITSKGQTLVITRGAEGNAAVWGLADRGDYPVQQDKLRELLTGLTELRLTEPRTADPALLERLGLGDPKSATSTAAEVKVLDQAGQSLADLIVGHRRVRTQGNVPETVYVRRPGENQSWLAEGTLPVDADPQLWFDRDIANIDHTQVASVVVHRGEDTLEFGRDGDKMVLRQPADHPKLDDYKVEDVFRSLETLTLTDVKPVAQEPGDKVGAATITLTDGTVVDVVVFAQALPGAKPGDAPDIWTQYAVSGSSDQAKKLAKRVKGWAYQVGAWKEQSFVPTLDDLKANEKPAAPAPTEGEPKAP